MKLTKWATRWSCAALALALLTGGAIASGSQGSEQNPLVTLSYLNEVVVPEILRQVDEKINAGAETLPPSGEVFRAVELKGGQSVTLSAGSQLLVRLGKLQSASALADLTDGTTWNGDGGGMKENHLYLATGEGQRVSAESAATVMVLGRYALG